MPLSFASLDNTESLCCYTVLSFCIYYFLEVCFFCSIKPTILQRFHYEETLLNVWQHGKC